LGAQKKRMLIEFNVENYLSFKDLTTISMVAVKSFKEHQKTHIFPVDSKLNLLKSAVIYGNNASGKSNLLTAMGFMKDLVLNSFRDALLESSEQKFPLIKFKLNSKTEKESSFFEISFIQNEIKYRYGFEIDYHKVIAEWLYHTTSKEVYLFKRDNQKIEINKSAFKEGLGKENDVKENVLFLSMLATLNKETSNSIIEWFKKFRFVNGVQDMGHKSFTIESLKSDKNFLNWVSYFVKFLEITNISTSEVGMEEIDLDNLKKNEKDEELINLFTSITNKLKTKQIKRDQIIAYHRKYDENNILLDTIPFNFDDEESEGTKKLLYLLGPWYYSLKYGFVLVVDELDSRLHTNLTLKLIEFFHKTNKNNAQLIFAVHDISFLNKETFRRDQIWFIEKNQFGSSELLSLADFKTNKVRNKSAFDKNYIEGKYGAIPYFEINDKLIQLLYGKKG
jgi:AAA15 family ATPase/GTPase